MPDISIETYLRRWRKKYGKEGKGRAHGNTYISVPISERRRLIIVFLRWMKMLGFEQERFSKLTFKKELTDICVGKSEWLDPKKKLRAEAATIEELEDILATEGIFEGKKPKKAKPSPSYVPPKPQENAPSPSQTSEPKFVGEDITESPYGNNADSVQIDEEFAKLIGVNTDVWK